jgi:hypothetical protein
MKIYVTKYALTEGIQEMEGEEPTAEFPGLLVVRGDRGQGQYTQYFHGEGREWHRTYQGASAQANKMARKEIESVKRKLERLKGLKF